ncbi:MAG: hypothetical protein ABIQ13_08140 [Pedococcus sp.]
MATWAVLGAWGHKQWLVAAAAATGYALAVAVPTDLVDTPVFSREIPPTWWSWPAVVLSALLVGLLAATYVSGPEPVPGADGGRGAAAPSAQDDQSLSAYAGGFLSFFAVGCPVCNKLVLLALGYTGALTWFQPLQPLLQLLGLVLLSWALRRRLSAARFCPVPMAP